MDVPMPDVNDVDLPPVTSLEVSVEQPTERLVPDQAAAMETTPGRRNTKRTVASFPMVDSDELSKPRPRKKKEKKDETDDTQWICAECREADALADLESDLMLCEGPCNRPFHPICLGMKESPQGTWICNDCKTSRHSCAICQEFGQDNVDVYLCDRRGCGLFFHESCLTTYNVDVRLEQVHREAVNGVPQDGQMNDDTAETRPVFRCPAHQCWTCKEELILQEDEKAPVKKSKGKKGKGKKLKLKDTAFASKNGHLFRCMECPIAYHISCIPPTARFHELALLCHDHALTCKLPTLDIAASYQGQVERKADESIDAMTKDVAMKTAKRKQKNGSSTEEENVFFLGLHGDTITSEEDKTLNHCSTFIESQEEESIPRSLQDMLFCLPCGLKDEVYAKPPAFRLVHSLKYSQTSKRPKRKDPSEASCKCVDKCDENCHNRVMFLECSGDSSKSNGSKNPYWNCNQGTECGNRALGLRQSAKCKPQRERGKGWGLVTLQPLKIGGLVQEYVGEVIDEVTKEERLREWARDHPNDPNFYVMALDPGWYIDARLEANLSRFINHSCQPNCDLRRIHVAGYARMGIFALTDIAPGAFLSYDYHFDTRHGDKFICRCGAVKCRGSMKEGKYAEEEEQKTAKQALAAAKAREDKDLKYLADVSALKEAKFSLVDGMIPAFEYPSESVALGPHDRHRLDGRLSRVFLWRNVVIGGKFFNRSLLLDRPRKRKARTASIPIVPIDLLGQLKALQQQQMGVVQNVGEGTLKLSY